MAKKKAAKKVAKKATAKKPVKTAKPAKKVAKKTTKKVVKKAAPKKVVKKAAPKKVVKKAAPKKVVKKAAPKKVVKKAAPKKVVKKAAPKKVAKKVAQKVVPKAAPKKIIKKVAAKKATPTKVAKKVAVKKSIAKVEKKIAAPKKVAAKTVGPKKPAKNVAAKKAAPKKVEAKGALKKSSKKEKVIIEQENEDELDLADTSKSIKPEDVIDVVIDSAAVESDAKKVKKRTNEQVVKESITDEILALSEDFGIHDILSSIKTMDFFSTESGECLEKGCENPETTMGYCRYHYIKNWMEVKKKQGILEEGKLHSLIQELVEKFPVKNLEAILNDLVDDKTFFKVLQELNIEGGGPGTEDGQDENFDDDDSDFAFEAKGGSKPSFNEE